MKKWVIGTIIALILIVLIIGAFLVLNKPKKATDLSGGFIPVVDYSGTEDTGQKIEEATDSNVFDDTRLNPFE